MRGAGHGQRLHLAALDQWRVAGDVVDGEVGVAGHQGGHRLRSPAKRNVDRVNAGANAEQLARQVRRGADAGRAKAHALGFHLRPAHELLHRLGRMVGGHDERVAVFPDFGHIGKVVDGVVGYLGKQELVDREGSDCGRSNSLPIGRRVLDRLHADVAASPRPVVHHPVLTELALQLFGQLAGQYVRCAPGAEGNDDLDRGCRPVAVLGIGSREGQGGQGSDGCLDEAVSGDGHLGYPCFRCGLVRKIVDRELSNAHASLRTLGKSELAMICFITSTVPPPMRHMRASTKARAIGISHI